MASAIVSLLLWAASIMAHGGTVTGIAASERDQLPKGVPAIDQAIERFKNAEYDQCLTLLKTAAASHPDMLPPRLLFAKLCLLLEKPAMGRAALEEAAVESPALPDTYLLFGRLALRDNRLTDAQLQFDKAIALTVSGSWPDPVKQGFLSDAHSGLAGVSEKRKDWPAATANLMEWLKLEPKNGPARQRLAVALFHQGQREQARVELEQAVKDEPTLDPAAVVMGRLFTEEGNIKTAAEWMEYAVKLAPADPKAHLGYAVWLLDQNQPDQAKIEADSPGRLDAGSREIKGVRGLIAWHLKDYPAAERIFGDLHVETPGNLGASNFWALSMAEQPSDAQRSRAWQVAQMNTQLYPNAPEALTTLGWTAFRLGMLDQAEQTLRAAIATGKAGSETAYFLARVLADRRKDGEVEPLLKMSLGVPGRFAFRKDAQDWLDRLQKTGNQTIQKTVSN
jgi:Tfp pilus assembly protein PilF